MPAVKSLLSKLKRGPTDVVGIHVGHDETVVARIKRDGGQICLVGADRLPPVNPQHDASEEAVAPTPLSLPPRLKGRHACLTIPGDRAIVKLLSCPGHLDAESEAKVVESMALENPEQYRIAYKVITEGTARGESRALTVALPSEEAGLIKDVLPAGLPAPFSLEVSALATMTAFLHGPGAEDGAVGVLNIEPATTTLGFFNRGVLALVRRFSYGTDAVIERIQSNLNVDRDTARGILSDGAFDISQALLETMDHLVKQLMISRDFVERRHNCQVSRMYLTGSPSRSESVLAELNAALGLDVAAWDPLAGLNTADGALGDDLSGQEWRFAPAVGACLAAFEET